MCLNSPVAVKRVKAQSPSGQTPETPPRLCWLIPGFKIRFDAFDLTKFYEGVTRTLSHTLFTVSYQQSAHPRFAVWRRGGACRAEAELRKHKQEKNRNSAVPRQPLDLSTVVSWILCEKNKLSYLELWKIVVYFFFLSFFHQVTILKILVRYVVRCWNSKNGGNILKANSGK